MSYKQYGRWTIIEEKDNKFFCRCECGTEKLVNKSNIIDGRSKSCGCLAKQLTSKRKLNDLTGRIFGKWTVLNRAANSKSNMTKYLCRCQCDKEREIFAKHLNSGDSTSCGNCTVKTGDKHPQWNGCGDISGDWWSSHISAASRQRRNSNITPVKITKEFAWNLFLKQERKCALSGLTLIISNDHKLNTASIDRIDSAKGYVEENVQWVHKHINIMKNRFEQQYFIEMCKLVSGVCRLK